MVRAPFAPPAWSRSALRAVAFALGLAGCENTIALGTECPPIGKECIDSTSRPPPPPPVRMDAGETPTPTADAEPPDLPDAAPPEPDAAPPEPDAAPPPGPDFPGFLNPSFELTTGAPNGGALGVLSKVTIEPWQWCGGLVGARPEDDRRNTPVGPAGEMDIVRPTDQATLVSMAFAAILGPATFGQNLSAPLEKGRTYGFAVDVLRSGDADARLEVWGSSERCVALQRLAQSDVISTEGQKLQTICLSFTPETEIAALTLVMSPLRGARLFLDNLRPATAALCP